MWVTWSLGQEAPLEKEMAKHSSILAWRIPWTEEPDELQSMGSQRIGHNRATNSFSWLLSIHSFYTPFVFVIICGSISWFIHPAIHSYIYPSVYLSSNNVLNYLIQNLAAVLNIKTAHWGFIFLKHITHVIQD